MGWKFHLSCDLDRETQMMWRSPYTRASWLRCFILFTFLRGQITLEELQRQWGEASKQSSVDSRKQPAWTKLLLPCRTCSETASDKDCRWPARCFIEDISKDKLWEHILLGYDLLCYKCQRTKTNQRRTRFLMCEQCQDLCRRGAFSTETQRRWDAGETGVMLCYRHESEPGMQVSRAPGESVACTRCKEVWPENCFATEELRGLATSLRCLCWICLAEERHPESFRAKKACPGLFGFVSVNSFCCFFVVLTPSV